MAGCQASSLDPSSVLQPWNHVNCEHANCCMYVRCVSKCAFTMLVFFLGKKCIYVIECSSRRWQTSSSAPEVPSLCPLVTCSFQVTGGGFSWLMLSFSSRTRGLGNQASYAGLSRTTLTTTSVPPSGKWQTCVSLLTLCLFRADASNSTNENWSQHQKFRAILVKFFFLANLLPLEGQDHFLDYRDRGSEKQVAVISRWEMLCIVGSWWVARLPGFHPQETWLMRAALLPASFAPHCLPVSGRLSSPMYLRVAKAFPDTVHLHSNFLFWNFEKMFLSSSFRKK